LLESLRYPCQEAGENKEKPEMLNRKLRMAVCLMAALTLSGSLVFTSTTNARLAPGQNPKGADSLAPDLKGLDSSPSELRILIERYVVDRGSLSRSYPMEISTARQARFKQFYSDWLATLAKLNFDTLSQDGKVDYLLFKTQLNHELQQLELQNKSHAEIAPFTPFAQTIIDLAEARRRMEKIDPAKIAATLNNLNKQIEATRAGQDQKNGRQSRVRHGQQPARRAADVVRLLQRIRPALHLVG
jgi:hypothetical protein